MSGGLVLSEEEKNDFENMQRVLSDTASAQITIMTFTLGFQSSGWVGMSLMSDKFSDYSFRIVGLAAIMFMVSVILMVVWLREHALAKAFREQLEKKFKVWMPGRNFWDAKTGCMWMIIHIGSVLCWFVMLIVGLTKNCQQCACCI